MAVGRNTFLLVTASGIAVTAMADAEAAPLDTSVANWTGWYAGLNLGVTQHDASTTDVNHYGLGGFGGLSYVTPFFTSRDTNVGFGGQVGYNQQYNNFVVGGEADLDWVGANITFQPPNNLFGCGPCAVSATNELKWMSTFRARAGYAFGNLLLFGTAGLAVGAIDDRWGLGFVGGGSPAFSDSQFKFDGIRAGFIYGGGVEYAMTAHWRARADVMHVDFGTASSTYTGPTPFVTPGTFTTNFHNSATLGHLAFSYRW
jgi:outer membrane immunogenic protein